jgi:hypothetical protein
MVACLGKGSFQTGPHENCPTFNLSFCLRPFVTLPTRSVHNPTRCATRTAQRDIISFFNKDAARPAPFDPLDSITSQPRCDRGTIRASRKDLHLHSTSTIWYLRVADIARRFTGFIPTPSLPPFSMVLSSPNQIPATPRGKQKYFLDNGL